MTFNFGITAELPGDDAMRHWNMEEC